MWADSGKEQTMGGQWQGANQTGNKRRSSSSMRQRLWLRNDDECNFNRSADEGIPVEAVSVRLDAAAPAANASSAARSSAPAALQRAAAMLALLHNMERNPLMKCPLAPVAAYNALRAPLWHRCRTLTQALRLLRRASLAAEQ